MIKKSIVKKSILLFFLILMRNVCGQAKKIDSLENLLKNHVVQDTTRVQLLNGLAKLLLEKDSVIAKEYLSKSSALADSLEYDVGKGEVLLIQGKLLAITSYYRKGFEFYEEALNVFTQSNSIQGKLECLQNMGYYEYRNGFQSEAVTYYQEALKLSKGLNDPERSFELLTSIGWSYIKLSRYKEALAYYQKALKYETKNNTLLINTYSDLGIIYSQQDNFVVAVKYYNMAMDKARRSKNEMAEYNALGNLGTVYQHMKKYDKAIESFQRAIYYFEDKNKEALASCYNNLGLVYSDTGEASKALEAIKNAHSIYTEINNLSGRAFTLNNLGDILLGMNDLNKAERYFKDALNLNTKIDNRLGQCVSYLGLAKIYALQNKNDLALEWAFKSSDISKNHNFIKYQSAAYQLKSKLYSKLGNYKKALESHEQFKILNDSLFNKENIEKIAQLESEYKYKQALDSANIRELKLTKTVLTTSQDLAKSRQNYLWAIIGILGISILSGSLVFYQKYKTIKVTNQNIVTEQKLLRSQMTPHFIFNSLSVLQGMILNKEEKKSLTYLSKFSKLLRIVLENSRDKVVPLIQELDAIDNYMILQNLDADPPYIYSLVVDENIDIDLFLVPPMLIQPFIENAIEHAFTVDQEQREIEVHLSLKDKKLSCTITDNGIGIDTISKKANMNKRSLATTITGERLHMLAKDFHMQGNINIEDRKKYNEQGTLVTLIIPYKMNKNS